MKFLGYKRLTERGFVDSEVDVGYTELEFTDNEIVFLGFNSRTKIVSDREFDDIWRGLHSDNYKRCSDQLQKFFLKKTKKMLLLGFILYIGGLINLGFALCIGAKKIDKKMKKQS